MLRLANKEHDNMVQVSMAMCSGAASRAIQEARLTGTWQGRDDVDAAGPVMPELMTVEQFQEALVLGFHGASSNTVAQSAFTMHTTLAPCKVPCKRWVSSLLHACQVPDMPQYAR